ncbi:MAG: pseudouridine synthase [Acidimicrobiia bacterium]|nr:pseudouridine synthase [Acidimicrobiia bacterium]
MCPRPMWLEPSRRPSVTQVTEPPSRGEPMRIQKAISRAGLMSRRSAEDLIRAGRVTVDDEVSVLGDRVDPTSQTISVDGVAIPTNPTHVTYLLYKPLGVISTADDPQKRQTVLDLVPDNPRVYPVGRLDADSEGLILLTNDGDLTLRVTHPRYGITKTYVIRVPSAVGEGDVARLVSGIDLDDGPAAAVSAKVVARDKEKTLVEMVMGEGRNREIRRMFTELGYEITALVRTGIGPITDNDLAPGTWRVLDNEEIMRLNRQAESS